MAVYRGPLPTDNYTIVSNDWARDPDLGLKEKGLLLAISSHRVGYALTMEQLVAQNTDGRSSIYTGLQKLVDAGYMVVVQNRTADGRMAEVDYRLTGKLGHGDHGEAVDGEEQPRSKKRRLKQGEAVEGEEQPRPTTHRRRSKPFTENRDTVRAAPTPSPPFTENPYTAKPRTEEPRTENPPLRRPTPKKITNPKKTIHVTSTCAREVEAAADPVEDTRPSTKGLVEVNGNDALDQVDADELERTVLALPDRLRPTASDATRLRDLIAQRMRRGWSREDIVEAVDRRLRPGALDNPCGLFAKTLVPLDEAPPRRHLALAKPWCGQCDERTRRPLDDLGFPDPTQPKCGDCDQLIFAQHMERGAS